MPRLLLDQSPSEGRISITGDLAHHLIRSLRVKVGERITAVDPGGTEHGAVVAAVGRDTLDADVVWSRPAAGEPRLQVTVLQALIREMDDVVAGLTHAGAAAIRPVVTRRSVVRPPAARSATRMERWRSIARDAAQLAGRARIPAILEVCDLATALGELEDGTRILACVIGSAPALATLPLDAAHPCALVIGPEGGLDPGEQELLSERGATAVHLGPHTLPAQSAGQAAVMLALARAGDLDGSAPPPPWPS